MNDSRTTRNLLIVPKVRSERMSNTGIRIVLEDGTSRDSRYPRSEEKMKKLRFYLESGTLRLGDGTKIVGLIELYD